MGARFLTLVVCILDAVVLLLIRPHPRQLVHRLGAPRAWLTESPDAALAAVSGTLLWLVAAWLGVGVATTVLAQLPGAIGQGCSAISRPLLPAALRRVVAGSVGLTVLLAPLPVAVGPLGHATAQPITAAALPVPVWPDSSHGSRPKPPARTPPVEAPAPEPPAPTRTDASVVVHPGDSLWLIAARRLGADATDADIAATWPRWYAANRQRIGPDPGLIRPGQRLVPPDRRPQP